MPSESGSCPIAVGFASVDHARPSRGARAQVHAPILVCGGSPRRQRPDVAARPGGARDEARSSALKRHASTPMRASGNGDGICTRAPTPPDVGASAQRHRHRAGAERRFAPRRTRASSASSSGRVRPRRHAADRHQHPPGGHRHRRLERTGVDAAGGREERKQEGEAAHRRSGVSDAAAPTARFVTRGCGIDPSGAGT